MKRLFKGGPREEAWSPKYLSRHSAYNLPSLPRMTFMRALEVDQAHHIFRTIPDTPFDRIVYHCWGKLTAPEVPLMYEMHRVVAGPIILFHHKLGKKAKRYHTAMRLVGFSRSTQLPTSSPISIWWARDHEEKSSDKEFKPPRCKTKVLLE